MLLPIATLNRRSNPGGSTSAEARPVVTLV